MTIKIRTEPKNVALGLAAGVAIVGAGVAGYTGFASLEGHESWPLHDAGVELNHMLAKSNPKPTGYRSVSIAGPDNYPYNEVLRTALEAGLDSDYVNSEFRLLNPGLNLGSMQIGDKYMMPIFQGTKNVY